MLTLLPRKPPWSTWAHGKRNGIKRLPCWLLLSHITYTKPSRKDTCKRHRAYVFQLYSGRGEKKSSSEAHVCVCMCCQGSSVLLETGNIFRLCLLSCSRDEGTLHTIWILMRLQLNGAGGEGFAMYVYLMLADIKFTCLPSSQKREREKDWHRGLTSEDDAAPPLHFPFTTTEPPKSNPSIRRRSLAWLLSSHVPALHPCAGNFSPNA